MPAPTVDNLLMQIEQHGERFMFAAVMPEILSVAGGQLPLGPVLHIMHSTRITNLDDVRAWRLAGADGSIDVRLEPGGNTDMTVPAALGDQPTVGEVPLAS